MLNELPRCELQQQVTEVIQLVRDKQQTLGFAESCTGRLLSSLFTVTPGVSDIFIGSVVSYANDVKTNVLGVRAEDIKSAGAVSDTVARQMAEGAKQVLKSKLAVAITGIAGPNGGSLEKPVGMVFIAVAGTKGETRVFHHLFSGSRKQIQQQSCWQALEHLKNFLKKNY